MPNRIIKESICTSEELASISATAEVLFYRLIVKADDYGLYFGNPKIISGTCFPLTTPKESKVLEWLDELCRVGLVARYTGDDGKPYIKIMTFDKHQQRRATKSKFPQPQAIDINCNQLQSIAPINENVNENVNENDNNTCAKAAQADDGFNEFWSAYPRKVGKKDAVKAWKKLKPDDALRKAILDGVGRWKQSDQWQRDNGQYIPYPATFLNGERWNDDCSLAIGKRAPPVKNYDEDEDFLKEWFCGGSRRNGATRLNEP